MKKVWTVFFTILIISVILVSSTSCSKEKAQTSENKTGTKDEKPKKEAKTATVKKACDVLSAEEASAVMGTSLVESKDPNDENIAPTGEDDSFCAYTNNGESDATRRKIFFSLALSSSPEGEQTNFNASKNLTPDAQTVENLGEGAFWNPNNNSLNVAKGRYQLLILITQPEKGGLDKATAAAKIIIPRLQ